MSRQNIYNVQKLYILACYISFKVVIFYIWGHVIIVNDYAKAIVYQSVKNFIFVNLNIKSVT